MSDIQAGIFIGSGIYLALVMLVGVVAEEMKNRSGFGWAAAALIFSPLWVLLLLMLLPKVEKDAE